MSHIQTLYIVHHSHTDIGYTDLQERVISNQVQFIRQAVRQLKKPENADFRWNCETLYCVEQFLKQAPAAEQADFFELVRQGKIGMSANWLNMTDLCDIPACDRKVKEVLARFKAEGIEFHTAMCADINGVSMGYRDMLIDNGVEFFYTNIHCHHGMYPLGHNQCPYFWENDKGQRLLVWNGEHYNLGNGLGIVPVPGFNYFGTTYCGQQPQGTPLEILHHNVSTYLSHVEDNGYPYDFLVTSVSGVFSDNAPPNPVVARMTADYNRTYDDVRLQMVTLAELYELIRDKVQDAPVYRGDLTDWWANGVGSTPYAVKHYREAQKLNRIASKLSAKTENTYPALQETIDDNLLLYAEHTWGHSSTISNPFDTMVLNLDTRKNSYASKAHEAAASKLCALTLDLGGSPTYYNVNGSLRAVSTNEKPCDYVVSFYVETVDLPACKVVEKATGRALLTQTSPHPRGRMVSFLDHFEPFEEKEYSYFRQEVPVKLTDSRHSYVGAEKVRDIISDFDPETYHLPYYLENEFFTISWNLDEGFTSFVDKKSGAELLTDGVDTFFTPLYERTAIRDKNDVYEERRLIGRNIRGLHAKLYQAEMTDVATLENGPVFTLLEFTFHLEGTAACTLLLKFYKQLPKVEFTLRTAKTYDNAIESVFLPLTLNLPEKETWIEKGGVAFRPGIDQLPGTCCEYYIADKGLVFSNGKTALRVACPDVPLMYMGDMFHHPISLCSNDPADNQKSVYSWIMNNTWETNFKMDLSGCCEFCYSVSLGSSADPRENLRALENDIDGVTAFILDEE